MMPRIHSFFIAVLLLLAGLLAMQCVAGQVLHDKIPSAGKGSYASPAPLVHHIAYSLGSSSSDKAAHEEKRHRKTLVSQAIVANFSLPRPLFHYYNREYSFFLPGARSLLPLDHSFLRGPPFDC